MKIWLVDRKTHFSYGWWTVSLSRLPGRTLSNGQPIWVCNAHYADSKIFSRSLLAKVKISYFWKKIMWWELIFSWTALHDQSNYVNWMLLFCFFPFQLLDWIYANYCVQSASIQVHFLSLRPILLEISVHQIHYSSATSTWKTQVEKGRTNIFTYHLPKQERFRVFFFWTWLYQN